jgi:hypothetical protein
MNEIAVGEPHFEPQMFAAGRFIDEHQSRHPRLENQRLSRIETNDHAFAESVDGADHAALQTLSERRPGRLETDRPTRGLAARRRFNHAADGS